MSHKLQACMTMACICPPKAMIRWVCLCLQHWCHCWQRHFSQFLVFGDPQNTWYTYYYYLVESVTHGANLSGESVTVPDLSKTTYFNLVWNSVTWLSSLCLVQESSRSCTYPAVLVGPAIFRGVYISASKLSGLSVFEVHFNFGYAYQHVNLCTLLWSWVSPVSLQFICSHCQPSVTVVMWCPPVFTIAIAGCKLYITSSIGLAAGRPAPWIKLVACCKWSPMHAINSLNNHLRML